MVLPVGGFFPIPLAMMIPFMATQSLVMGEAFGKAFQFGKRKMSAMSNDEFNKLKIEDVASEMFKSYKNILPELKTSIADSADFQNHIFAQLILLGPNLIKALGGAVLTDIAEKVAPTPDVVEGERVRQPGITDIPEIIKKDVSKFNPPSKIHSRFKPSVVQVKKITDTNRIRGIKNQLVSLNRQLTSLEIARNHVRTSAQANYINRKIAEMHVRIKSLQSQL